MAFYEATAKFLFERGKAPMHGRLIDLQRLGGRERAAFACYCQQMAQVVPIEHAGSYAFLPSRGASLLLPERRLSC